MNSVVAIAVVVSTCCCYLTSAISDVKCWKLTLSCGGKFPCCGDDNDSGQPVRVRGERTPEEGARRRRKVFPRRNL
jgi:hypothetical protein